MEDDLVISFQLLLCTLEFCIKRCPPELLQPLYSKSQDLLFAPVLELPLYVSWRLTNGWCSFYCSESAVSKVQSPPARTARRSQSKAKSKPPEPEMDLQLLKTLCQENDCNSEEVGGPHPLFNRYTSQLFCLYTLCILSLLPLYCGCRWRMCTRPASQLSWTHSICQEPHNFLRSGGRTSQHLLRCLSCSPLTFPFRTSFCSPLPSWSECVTAGGCLHLLPACLSSHIWCQKNVCSGRGLLCCVNSTLQC